MSKLSRLTLPPLLQPPGVPPFPPCLQFPHTHVLRNTHSAIAVQPLAYPHPSERVCVAMLKPHTSLGDHMHFQLPVTHFLTQIEIFWLFGPT